MSPAGSRTALREAIVELTIVAMRLQVAELYGSHDLVVGLRQQLIRQYDELGHEAELVEAAPVGSRID